MRHHADGAPLGVVRVPERVEQILVESPRVEHDLALSRALHLSRFDACVTTVLDPDGQMVGVQLAYRTDGLRGVVDEHFEVEAFVA